MKVRIPASCSNLGSGFDCIGLAVKIYNEIEVNPSFGELKIEIEGQGSDTLPRDENNLVYKAIRKVTDRIGIKNKNFRIKVKNNIPIERGLGSSATAYLGGIVCANALIGNKFHSDEILKMALELEGHPDNLIPSMFGGLCITSTSGGELRWAKIENIGNISIVLCIPDFKIETKKARAVLPENIPFFDGVEQLSYVSFLIYSFTSKKYDFLRFGMRDKFHQPYRTKLFPFMEEVFESAMKSGAYGSALSGSGPTVVAFGKKNLEKIGKSMKKVFEKHGFSADYIITEVDRYGLQLLE